MTDVRMDKWLWAARFFKTRALAAKACELGRVISHGQLAKSARPVRVGDMLQVKTEGGDFEVEVLLLSEVRGPAAVAQTLYRETDASRALRARVAEERKVSRHHATRPRPPLPYSARSASQSPSLNWRPKSGTSSSSVRVTTASLALPTWHAPASASWCSRAGHAWAALVRSKNPSRACGCRRAPIWPDFSIRW
jgi:ribosome-associated heat shock protein Hsp15